MSLRSNGMMMLSRPLEEESAARSWRGVRGEVVARLQR